MKLFIEIPSLTCLIWLALLQPAHAVAGSGSGSHGGDNKQLVQRSAWFPPLKQVSRTPIHYCYNLSPSFSVQDQIRITSAIETAYAEWHRYISDATKRQNEGNLLEIYQDMRLLVFDSACEEKTDLVFYLGQDSDPVTEERLKYDNPAAFSKILSRSTQTSQVKGFVWLHPGSDKDPFVYRDSYWHQDLTQSCSLHWNDNNAFELIIKHELGHVMGFTHVAGTLMDEKFLEATALNQCQVWPHVERNVRDEPLNLNIDASPVYFQSNRQILMSPSVSGFVSRHLISPFVHQTLVWDNRSIPATLTYTPEGLRITGTASTGPFQVDLEASNRIFGSKTGLFTELDDVFVVCEIGIRFSNESIECTTLKQLAFVRSFQARDESGKHHHFILSYNMESAPPEKDAMHMEYLIKYYPYLLNELDESEPTFRGPTVGKEKIR